MIDAQTLAGVGLVAFDFDGVFTDNTVYVNQDGIESVRCWRSDGLGLSRMMDVGVKAMIISTEKNTVVSARAKKLNLPCKQSVSDKAAAILEACREFNINPINAMFVGNDFNDIPAFEIVGIPVAVADAYPDVDPHVVHRTRKPGGFGAVREICDMVYHAKNGTLDEYQSNAR